VAWLKGTAAAACIDDSDAFEAMTQMHFHIWHDMTIWMVSSSRTTIYLMCESSLMWQYQHPFAVMKTRCG
jgi:hypothetical protein